MCQTFAELTGIVCGDYNEATNEHQGHGKGQHVKCFVGDTCSVAKYFPLSDAV